jgi:hypothetical protein
VKKGLKNEKIQRKAKKVVQKFGGFKKTPYLCTAFQRKGRLAQLV